MALVNLARAGDQLAALELPDEGLVGLAPQLVAVARALARVQLGLAAYVETVDTEARLDASVMRPLWEAVDGLADVARLAGTAAGAEERAYAAHHEAAESGRRVAAEFALPERR